MNETSNNFSVALTKCFYCGEGNQLVINTELTQKCAQEVEELNGKVISMEPCSKCKELMKQGVMFISCKDDDPEYRTGKIAVIKDEAIKELVTEPLQSQILKARFCFCPDSEWEKIFPKEVFNN